jgi:DnaJ domain
MTATFFTALGVSASTSPAQIRGAYMKLAREMHPDVDPSKAEQFTLVTAAWNALKGDEYVVLAYARRVRLGCMSGSETAWSRAYDALVTKREAPKTAKPGACGAPTKSGPCCRPEGHTPNGHMSQKVSDTKAANYRARKAAQS